MIPYWLLFAYVAIMALAFPVRSESTGVGAAQTMAFLVFIAAYVLMATLRYRIGGDWTSYEAMYDIVGQDSPVEAMRLTDPLFGLLLWVSAQFKLGIYPVNGVCAALIGYGSLRLALRTREPWLALVAAVPYLLIVVGMGYVRQAGAIGMVMIAVASADRAKARITLTQLVIASGLHSTSSVTFPLFGRIFAERSRPLAWVMSAIGAIAFLYILSGRLTEFEVGYIDAQYDSGGAAVRLLMNLLPSLLLLARWRNFRLEGPSRSIWLGFAIANIVAVAALLLSPSSTAVDRMALYFSPIQLIVFGSILDLIDAPRESAHLVRMLAIAVAASVQVVWLFFATNAYLWVPYRSILELM